MIDAPIAYCYHCGLRREIRQWRTKGMPGAITLALCSSCSQARLDRLYELILLNES